MQTSGRGSSEKAMIIIPAIVLLFVMVVVTGGPVQFVRFLNNELREVSNGIQGMMSRWF